MFSVHGSAYLSPILSRAKDMFDMETAPSNSIPEGMSGRIVATILTFFGSIIGIILWLFFYAANFNVYQNIAVVVVILLGFVAVMGATWASWGMKQGARWSRTDNPKSAKD
jgi:VIT1/CCC1 family predicted Fe2+/Mn2+ transporter